MGGGSPEEAEKEKKKKSDKQVQDSIGLSLVIY